MKRWRDASDILATGDEPLPDRVRQALRRLTHRERSRFLQAVPSLVILSEDDARLIAQAITAIAWEVFGIATIRQVSDDVLVAEGLRRFAKSTRIPDVVDGPTPAPLTSDGASFCVGPTDDEPGASRSEQAASSVEAKIGMAPESNGRPPESVPPL